MNGDPPLAILKSSRIGRKGPVFDSLIDLSRRFEDNDNVELCDSVKTYELQVGGRKCQHSESTLLVLSRREGRSARLMAILNFTNSILGAGLMGLPYAVMRSGLFLGLLLLVLITVVVDWSVMLLIRCGRLACAGSYQELMGRVWGRTGAFVCGLFQVIFALGGMCAYMVILADNVTRIGGYYFADSLLTSRSFVVLFTSLFVILPLSLSRSLNFLGNFSLLALISVMFIITAVVFEAPGNVEARNLELFSSGFLESLGIISFAFVCHHNSFDIHDSLDIPSISVFSTVTHFSTSIAFVASAFLAVPAYLWFGQTTRANILNNFDLSSLLINLARFLLALSLVLTYPIDCFVSRSMILESFYGQKQPPEWAHATTTILLVSLTLVVSLGYTNLEIILELTGGLAASALAFIFPSACYLKLTTGHDAEPKKQRLLAKTLLVFGVIILFSSTINTIYRAI